MKYERKLFILIPGLLNEPESLKLCHQTVEAILTQSRKVDYPVQITVCAQGSFAGQLSVPNEVQVHREQKALGKWTALNKLRRNIPAHANDAVVTVDDDLPVLPESVFALAEPLIAGCADLVLSKRDRIVLPVKEGDLATERERMVMELLVNTEFLSDVFSAELQTAGDPTLFAFDINCGVNGWRHGISIDWSSIPNDWRWFMEIFRAAVSGKCAIMEIPVITHTSIGPSRLTVSEWQQLFRQAGFLDPSRVGRYEELMEKMYRYYLT